MEDFKQYIIDKYDNKEKLTLDDVETLIWEYEWERKEYENRR